MSTCDLESISEGDTPSSLEGHASGSTNVVTSDTVTLTLSSNSTSAAYRKTANDCLNEDSELTEGSAKVSSFHSHGMLLRPWSYSPEWERGGSVRASSRRASDCFLGYHGNQRRCYGNGFHDESVHLLSPHAASDMDEPSSDSEGYLIQNFRKKSKLKHVDRPTLDVSYLKVPTANWQKSKDKGSGSRRRGSDQSVASGRVASLPNSLSIARDGSQPGVRSEQGQRGRQSEEYLETNGADSVPSKYSSDSKVPVGNHSCMTVPHECTLTKNTWVQLDEQQENITVCVTSSATLRHQVLENGPHSDLTRPHGASSRRDQRPKNLELPECLSPTSQVPERQRRCLF